MTEIRQKLIQEIYFGIEVEELKIEEVKGVEKVVGYVKKAKESGYEKGKVGGL